MPLQRSLPQAHCRAHAVAVILLLSKVILLYFYYADKKLVYIAIAAPSSRQPSSCSKCTSANIRSSYNIHSVSNTKCLYTRRISLRSLLLPYSIYYRVSRLI